jgi:hypothetical protein
MIEAWTTGQAMMSDKRSCKGTNAQGEPSGASPLKPGTVIEGITVSGDYCRQHDLTLPDSARIGGATPGAARRPMPRAVDVLKERIEADIDKGSRSAVGWARS